jgi:hypothetical protein
VRAVTPNTISNPAPVCSGLIESPLTSWFAKRLRQGKGSNGLELRRRLSGRRFSSVSDARCFSRAPVRPLTVKVRDYVGAALFGSSIAGAGRLEPADYRDKLWIIYRRLWLMVASCVNRERLGWVSVGRWHIAGGVSFLVNGGAHMGTADPVESRPPSVVRLRPVGLRFFLVPAG